MQPKQILKSPTGVDISKFAKKVDLGSLKSNVDRLGIDKLKNVPSALSSLTLTCIKCFCNFTTWNGSPETHKRKCSVN